MSLAEEQVQPAMVGRAGHIQPARVRRQIGHTLLHIVMIMLGISFLTPLVWVLSTSLKLPGQVFAQPIEWIPTSPRWQNYIDVFQMLPFLDFIKNTMFVTMLGTVGTVLSSITVAFSLSRIR